MQTHRSARGNAVLIDLAFQRTLEPAYASIPTCSFLKEAVRIMRSLRNGTDSPTLPLDHQGYSLLADSLDSALDDAKTALPHSDKYTAHIRQTIAKAATRARRLTTFTQEVTRQ